MSSQRDVDYKGYALTDPKRWNDLKVTEFKPKTFDADDVEIAITHCGVCGSDHVVNTGKKEFWKDYALTLDLIVSTRDSFGDKMPLGDFLSMLYVHGRFVTVGVPDADDPLPNLHPFNFVSNGCLMGGSKIGSKQDCLEMLELARSKGIKPWIEEMPMCDVGKALQNVQENKVRYRYVLTQDLV
ncbi:hypothetical protein K466DRAFT_667685 [Polyporus arcularius HHB13444]|uniref:Alcohol dehydrogenase-like C-terminal domain-containing protein n=1 Tax=Polyporus arcularius HHB13444 TaxID=1314778 RepID=A0A5C3NVN7_9APHY|nr:hypothetical protein K466DRAFT_667685 [Polyporus arcularius HHB13444]